MKNQKILTIFVITFAAFIIAGLAIIPALDIQDADAADKKKNVKTKKKFEPIDPSLNSIIDNKLIEKLM
jgi:hypothetical protein